MEEFKECIKCTYRPETCVDCEVMYRGEPAKEEEVQVNNRFESQEYRLVKSVNFDSLLHTDIDPKIFKELCLEDGFLAYNGALADVIYDQSNFDYALSELERLGFIEKVVHDPVVEIGDAFRVQSGNIYHFSYCGDDKMFLTAVYIESDDGCNKIGQGLGWDSENNKKVPLYSKLSDCVGKENLHRYKPVKIKITEVEEG